MRIREVICFTYRLSNDEQIRMSELVSEIRDREKRLENCVFSYKNLQLSKQYANHLTKKIITSGWQRQNFFQVKADQHHSRLIVELVDF